MLTTERRNEFPATDKTHGSSLRIERETGNRAIKRLATLSSTKEENLSGALCAGVIRPSSEAIQLHLGTVRGFEHNETIVESQEPTEITQFPHEGCQAHGEPRFQGNVRRGERKTSRS